MTKPKDRITDKKISYGELYSRDFMNYIFNVEFKKSYPKWCFNPKTNRQLELDVYNDEYKIAVEYNGEMHYRYMSFYHESEEKFQEQLYRDEIKKQLCEENDVYLIVVPYTIEIKKIPIFIYCHLLQPYIDDLNEHFE